MTYNEYNHQLFNYDIEKGFYAKNTKIMSNAHWRAMSEAINLKVSQQRIENQHCVLHFGHR